ncbi:hypothetical protein E3J74_05905 [Candidatus Bathyarchaeota archaeon]|nr:MAG: hypothetical protein E3J74_05905 [Candidatus Bathyarchaeota archaeon]
MATVENKKITISILGGGWPTNIGNSFIELGSIHLLKTVAPHSKIHVVSGLPRWLFGISSRSTKDKLLIRSARILPKWMLRIPKRSKKERLLKKVSSDLKYCFDLMNVIESHYAVFLGNALHERFIRLYEPIFMKLKKNKVKIIIIGAGGKTYSDTEITEVTKFLKTINPYALISRDEQSFENYKDAAQFSHDGIDCGFFISDYFTPAKLRLPKYVTLNFDKHPEPRLNTDKLIIRTHHSCWPTWLSRGHFNKSNTLISDLPGDYLNLYANTEELHSDRVHACVATLSFGRPCKLYVDDVDEPRASLLDKVGAATIKEKLTYPNTKRIEKEKDKQIRFLSKILAN